MNRPEDETFRVPRFLAFIDLGYLQEALEVADTHLSTKVGEVVTADERNRAGNINATRQSLMRAAFISSFASIEQNLDELANMERNKRKLTLSPSDLKDRGIKRSLAYANKVLGRDLSVDGSPWKDLLLLQEVRNHLVHYGPGFFDSPEHKKRFQRFGQSKYVSLRPTICFTMEQMALIFDLYMECIQKYSL